MKRKIAIVIFILLSYTSVYSQKTLEGIITDETSKNPVPGALLYIPEYGRSAGTNEKGKYTFSNLGTGIVKIQITSVGYKSKVETVDLSRTEELNLTLESSATELEQVTVTSNYGTLPDNIPFSANSVSQDEIRKYQSPSVMGNLSYQPGIDRITIGNGIGKPVIRGLSFNRILLYGQGTRIENQQWDDHHDLGLTDAGIETVELVRGPAAIVYGADALGGALIFTDEKPAAAGTAKGDLNAGYASNTFGLSAEGGFKGTSRSGIFYGARLAVDDHTSYLMGEAKDVGRDPSLEITAFAPNSKFNRLTGKSNVGTSKSWGVSKLSYSILNQQIGIIEDESGPNAKVMTAKQAEAEHRNRKMEAPYQDVNTQIISLENTILTGKSKLNVNAAYQVNDRSEFEPDDPNKANIGLLLRTTTYDVKWTSDASKQLGYTIGSQGLFLKNENNGRESLVPDADVTDVAGYGLFRYDRNKINLLGGMRYDQRSIDAKTYSGTSANSDTLILINRATNLADTVQQPLVDFTKDYTPVSFSIGGAYHVNEHLTLKLNGATGFSAPNFAELATFGKHEGTYRFERGDINLAVEQNMEADLGFIWENEFISINAGGYINKINDYIYIVSTGDTMTRRTSYGRDTLPVYDYKQGDAIISGCEISFDIHPKAAKWFDFKTSFALISGTLKKGGNLPYIPANKIINEITFRKTNIGGVNDPYFSCIISNYFAQNNIAQYELSTEAYTLLDVHLGFAFHFEKQKIILDAFCTNLLNTGYYNHLSLIKSINIRDMGRNIGVRIKVPFGS